MKATVNRKDLQEALQLAGSASPTRSSLPALMSIRITVTSDKMELVGCDGEMWAAATLPAHVQEEGGVCVQQRLFSEIVAALGADQVEIELAGTNAILRSGASEWKMLTTAHDLFPPIPAVSPSSEVRLSMGDLRSCIEGVAYAVSEDRTREILTGVLMKYENNTLTCVATDTHRLAVHRLSREGIGSEISVIVPKKALDAIKRMPLGADEEITLRFDSDRLGVDIGNSVIVSQLLEGNYPNWERVVPSEYTRQWTLDRQELIENLKRASILAKNNSQRVTLSCKGEKLTISAKSDDLGQATEEVDVVPSNGDLDIAFNVKYILDALSALNGEGVRAEMTESTRPAVLRPVETEAERFCVVMPMALN